MGNPDKYRLQLCPNSPSRAPQNKTAPVYQIGAVARRALGGNDGSEQPKLASAQNGFTLNLGELERPDLLSRVSAVRYWPVSDASGSSLKTTD
jgi:hypothetical protein